MLLTNLLGWYEVMTIRKQIAIRIGEYDRGKEKLFMEVAESGQLEDVLGNRTTETGCYIIKLKTKATSNSDHYQDVIEHYQIISICSNDSQGYSSSVGDKTENMQKTIFKAVSGYVCTDDQGIKTNPLKLIKGGLIDLKNNLNVWADIYELSYTQKINQQD